MNLHPRELGITLVYALAAVVAGAFGLGVLPALAITLVLLGLLQSQLRLSLIKNSRDRYYAICPALFFFASLLTVSGFRHNPLVVLLIAAFILISYGLIRSIYTRKTEPLQQIPLHQNVFLSAVWIALFLAILSLYNLFSRPSQGLLLFIVVAFLLVFFLSQSLFHYVRIPPWQVRQESLAVAWGITQVLIIFAIWTVNPLTVAGISFLLLYLFWGLVYHDRIKQLTRKVLYEYLLLSSIGIGFLLLVTKFNPNL